MTFDHPPAAAAKTWRDAVAPVLDFLLPHLCAACRSPLGNEPGLCAPCWAQLNFIASPQCPCCGVPFPYDLGPHALCVDCLDHPPRFSMARAILRYDDAAKPLLLGFKHADKTHFRGLLGKMLLTSAQPVLAGADGMVPIPLHWTRLLKRKYNQAALLAEELAALSGVANQPQLLRRDKRTTPHVAMNRRERQRNVGDAFAVPAKELPFVRDKILVLVDDVYTTGSTVDAAAKTLLAAGAREIRVLTVARVCHEV